MTAAEMERDELQDAVFEGFEYYDLRYCSYIAKPTAADMEHCKYIPYILEFCSFKTH